MSRFARFLLVGGSCYLLGTGALYLFVEQLGLPTWGVWPPLWLLFQAVAYAAHRRVTFPDRRPSFWHGLGRYYSASAGSGVLSAALLFLVHDALGVPIIPATAIIAGGMPVINFFWQKTWTFRAPHQAARVTFSHPSNP